MFRPETLTREWQVLRSMLRGMPRERDGADAALRLEAFYAPQAAGYDAFRERLLHGRADLVARLDPPHGGHVVELGGGTGRNLEFFPSERRTDLRFTLVDLCTPLLAQARQRLRDWPHAHVIQADAASWRPDAPVDCVFFSYALTMIDAWRAAIDNAVAMLKPGGMLGVVDFYVSSANPPEGLRRHGAFVRHFWPRWFGHDGVRLDPGRLDYLMSRFPHHRIEERMAKVPYLPGMRVPVYLFVGTKDVPADRAEYGTCRGVSVAPAPPPGVPAGRDGSG